MAKRRIVPIYLKMNFLVPFSYHVLVKLASLHFVRTACTERDATEQGALFEFLAALTYAYHARLTGLITMSCEIILCRINANPMPNECELND